MSTPSTKIMSLKRKRIHAFQHHDSVEHDDFEFNRVEHHKVEHDTIKNTNDIFASYKNISPFKFESLKNTKFFNTNDPSKIIALYNYLNANVKIPEVVIDKPSESIYYKFFYENMSEEFNLSHMNENYIDIEMVKKAFNFSINYKYIPDKFKNEEFYLTAITWDVTKKNIIKHINDKKIKKMYFESRKIKICEYFLNNLKNIPDEFKDTYLGSFMIAKDINNYKAIINDKAFINNLMKNTCQLNINFDGENPVSEFRNLLKSIDKDSYKRLSYCVVMVLSSIMDFDIVLSNIEPEYLDTFIKLCILIRSDAPVIDKQSYDYYLKIYKTDISIPVKYRIKFVNVIEEKCEYNCCITYDKITSYYYKCMNKVEHVYDVHIYEQKVRPICFLCASSVMDFNNIYLST